MLKNKFLKIFSIVFVCLTLFTNIVSTMEIPATSTRIVQTFSDKKSELSPYSKLAKRLGISKKKIINLLTCKTEKDKISLVPLVDLPKYLKLWKDLFAKSDEEYMKYYAANGELRTKKKVEEDYYGRLAGQWNRKIPYSMTMVITFNGKPVGKTSIVSLVNFDDNNLTEMDYVLLEKFKGKGIMSRAVGLVLNFFKYLIKRKIYNFKILRITADMENIASQRVALKNGFIPEKEAIIVHDSSSKDLRINLSDEE